LGREREAAPAAMEPALRLQVLAVVDGHRSTTARMFADVATGVSKTDDADGSVDAAETAR
jgi:hypothetical protein